MRRTAVSLGLASAASVVTPTITIAQSPVPAIRFAPPLDRTLAYRVVQYVGTGKTQRRFESVRHLRFARDGGGYRLTVTLRDATGDAPAAAMARYRAALTPLIGVAQHMRVDGSGRIIAIDNMQDVWAAFLQGQQALLAASERNAATRIAIDHIASLDATDRLAVLAGDVQPLMLFASGTALPSMRKEKDSDPGTILFSEEVEANGVAARYTVEQATGLVVSAERDVVQPSRTLHEGRILTSLNE